MTISYIFCSFGVPATESKRYLIQNKTKMELKDALQSVPPIYWLEPLKKEVLRIFLVK